MVQNFSIEFRAAVSQNELEKTLHESGDAALQTDLHKMVADSADLKEDRAVWERLGKAI
jgi:hypothetical protein